MKSYLEQIFFENQFDDVIRKILSYQENEYDVRRKKESVLKMVQMFILYMRKRSHLIKSLFSSVYLLKLFGDQMTTFLSLLGDDFSSFKDKEFYHSTLTLFKTLFNPEICKAYPLEKLTAYE